MRGDTVKGHLDVLLLAILENEPTHGYAVIEELKRRSNGAFELPEGSVYPALHRLERAGYLKSRPVEVSGRRRRVYEITKWGRRALAQGRDEWREFSFAVRLVLGGTGV